VTPEDLNRAIVVAWVAALFIAAVLTVPVFLLHRRVVRSTNMHSLGAVVAIPCAIAVYAVAGMSFLGLVDSQMRRAELAESGHTFSAASILYHPGLTIKLSLVGTVLITWMVLMWWDRRT
jgi:hypothetical protein